MRIVIVMAAVLLLAVWAGAEQSDFEQGMAAYRGGELDSAVSHLREHVAAAPDAKGYYALGYAVYALERKGRREFGEAAEYFRQAYLIDPLFKPRSIGFDHDPGEAPTAASPGP